MTFFLFLSGLGSALGARGYPGFLEEICHLEVILSKSHSIVYDNQNSSQFWFIAKHVFSTHNPIVCAHHSEQSLDEWACCVSS